MLDNSKIKKAAREQLKSRWQIPFIAVLTSFIISFLLTTTEKMIAPDTITSALFAVFKLICTAIFGFSVVKISLDLTRKSSELSFTDYTDSFTYISPVIRAFLWVIFWIIIFILIITVPSSFIFLLSSGIALLKSINFENFSFSQDFNFEKFENFTAPEEFFTTLFTQYLGLAILMIVLFFVLLAVMIFKLLQYSQIMYVIADNKNVSARKAMRLSIEYMKGHKGELFCLYLSFFGWFLLCLVPGFFTELLSKAVSPKTAALIMTLLISVTFSILGPYFNASLANFYNAVKQDALESGRVKPEDLQ